MGRFATREDEVDDLFRLGVFVDLYRVVRQGLRAGVESYSIKRLEPLCGYERQVDLRDATANLIAFEAALEEGTAARTTPSGNGSSPGTTRTTAGRRWPCGTGWRSGGRIWPSGSARSCRGRSSSRRRPRGARGSRGHPDQVRVARRRSRRTSASVTDGGERRALLADLLDWHRREAKPAWWRYFYVRDAEHRRADRRAGRDRRTDRRRGRRTTSSGRWCGDSRSRRRSTVLGRGHGASTRDRKSWTVRAVDEERGRST